METAKKNEIRNDTGTPNKSILSHFAASYYPSSFDEFEVFVAFDKPWEKDFQDIPGIAPRGDQFFIGFNLQLVGISQTVLQVR